MSLGKYFQRLCYVVTLYSCTLTCVTALIMTLYSSRSVCMSSEEKAELKSLSSGPIISKFCRVNSTTKRTP